MADGDFLTIIDGMDNRYAKQQTITSIENTLKNKTDVGHKHYFNDITRSSTDATSLVNAFEIKDELKNQLRKIIVIEPYRYITVADAGIIDFRTRNLLGEYVNIGDASIECATINQNKDGTVKKDFTVTEHDGSYWHRDNFMPKTYGSCGIQVKGKTYNGYTIRESNYVLYFIS